MNVNRDIYYLQVKSLLQPNNVTQLHQKLHTFRAYELTKILAEQDSCNLLPSTCCRDFILWQCLIDEILRIELLAVSTATSKTMPWRKLTTVEENAIRFTAGYVMKKMLSKYKCDREATQCLKSLLKDADTYSHFSEVWTRNTDKGYLKHLSDEGYELFVEIEIVTYDKLAQLPVHQVLKI